LGSHLVAVVQHTFNTHLHTNNTQNDTKQAIHRTTQKNKHYIEQHKNIGSLMRAVSQICGFNLGICLTTEENARKNLSQDSRRVPAGTMKEYIDITIKIHKLQYYTGIQPYIH
jgi:hypothetical protein